MKHAEKNTVDKDVNEKEVFVYRFPLWAETFILDALDCQGEAPIRSSENSNFCQFHVQSSMIESILNDSGIQYTRLAKETAKLPPASKIAAKPSPFTLLAMELMAESWKQAKAITKNKTTSVGGASRIEKLYRLALAVLPSRDGIFNVMKVLNDTGVYPANVDGTGTDWVSKIWTLTAQGVSGDENECDRIILNSGQSIHDIADVLMPNGGRFALNEHLVDFIEKTPANERAKYINAWEKADMMPAGETRHVRRLIRASSGIKELSSVTNKLKADLLERKALANITTTIPSTTFKP